MSNTSVSAGASAPATGRPGLAVSLLTAIRARGGEWTTGRAAVHLNGIHPQRARRALADLAADGLLIQHDRHGRRYWTLNHARTDSNR